MDTQLVLLLIAGAGVARGITLLLQLMQRVVDATQLNAVIAKTVAAGDLDRSRKLLSVIPRAHYAMMLSAALNAWGSGASTEAIVEAFESERKQREPWVKAALSKSIFVGALGTGPLAFALVRGLPISTWLWASSCAALGLGTWCASLAASLRNIRLSTAGPVLDSLRGASRPSGRSA